LSVLVVRGDALHIPLPDESVDLIATSPPYWALRSYRDGDEHYDGQLGSEPDPFAFLDVLLEATAEMVRVLKPSGSLWVNLGDKYAERTGPARDGFWKGNQDSATFRQAPRPRRLKTKGVRPKSLIMIPQRYAIRCIDELGLILRAEVVWSKANSLPESVTDRVRRSHEHLFHFTKEPTYYAALDEVRETYAPGTAARYAAGYNPRKLDDERPSVNTKLGGDTYGENPLGKLPGSVWPIPAEPLQVPDYFVEDALGWRMMDAKPLWHYAWHQVVRAGDTRPIMVRSIDHFAAFPQELPRRIILGWSPSAICTACGQGRFPVVAKTNRTHRLANTSSRLADDSQPRNVDGRACTPTTSSEVTITGYACACTPRTSHRGKRGDWKAGRAVMPEHGSDDLHSPGNAVPRRPGGFGDKVPAPSTPMWQYHLDGWTPPPTRAAVVLDPFGGTGTTAGVADALGRHGIALDLSADYCRLARWRTEQSGHFAKTRERTNRENQGSLL
jgi:DNA modification methylase